MSRISFSIVGAGWRTEFYMRIVVAAPDVFEMPIVVVRNPDKAAVFGEQWGCEVCSTVDEMLSGRDVDFAVTSVPWKPNPDIVKDLVRRGVPVLSETPPAPDEASLIELWNYVEEHDGRVCVAEQYFLQPYFSAVRQVIDSGRLGVVSQAQISAAHGYHGMSLMRKALGVEFENPTIFSRSFAAPLVGGPGRADPPQTEVVAESKQTFFWLDFDGRLGFMDFSGDQYFNWVRSNRVLIRGERGEIVNNRLACLKDFRTPVYLEFERHQTGGSGNLEGNHLKGIQLGEEMVYENPLAPASLSDDEIAIGDLLLRMARYGEGGEAPYPLAEACQDHYLSLKCEEALESGAEVRTETQPWAEG